MINNPSLTNQMVFLEGKVSVQNILCSFLCLWGSCCRNSWSSLSSVKGCGVEAGVYRTRFPKRAGNSLFGQDGRRQLMRVASQHAATTMQQTHPAGCFQRLSPLTLSPASLPLSPSSSTPPPLPTSSPTLSPSSTLPSASQLTQLQTRVLLNVYWPINDNPCSLQANPVWLTVH